MRPVDHVVVGQHVFLFNHHAASAAILLLAGFRLLEAAAVAVAAVSITAVAVAEEVVPREPVAAAVAVAAVTVAVAVVVHDLVIVHADHTVPHLGNRRGKGGGQYNGLRLGRRPVHPEHGAGHHADQRKGDDAQYFLTHHFLHGWKPPFRFSVSLYPVFLSGI